ncbi:MAG: hypothetical protein HC831_11270 [Chloroflexia bacterium]|nr:hypothetical protein [Chloroflexia bacterium]
MKYRLYLVLFLVYLFGGCYDSTNVPVAKNGVIDLRNWNFEHNKNIELNGEWEFYWNQLLNPKDFNSGSTISQETDYVIIPDIWTTREANAKPSKGYATYRLNVLLKNDELLYGIKLIDCGTAFELFVNDSLVAQNGMVSKNAVFSSRHNTFLLLNRFIRQRIQENIFR